MWRWPLQWKERSSSQGTHTHTHTHRRTHGHRDSMTESAQWADSVKSSGGISSGHLHQQCLVIPCHQKFWGSNKKLSQILHHHRPLLEKCRGKEIISHSSLVVNVSLCQQGTLHFYENIWWPRQSCWPPFILVSMFCSTGFVYLNKN